MISHPTNPQSNVRPILFVEDDPMDVDRVPQSFEENAVINPLIICRDGEEALSFIDAHRLPGDSQLPLVVLLDLRLPKVDGLEVLRYARQQSFWKKIPFIVTTSSLDEKDLETALQLGITYYLNKPLDFTSFSELLKRIQLYWELAAGGEV